MNTAIFWKYVCFPLLLVCASSWGQAEKESQPLKVTLCDLYRNPEKYAGKMVVVRGRVAGNDLWIDEFNRDPCPSWMRVIVVFPDQVKPVPDFDLVRDDSFKKFESALSGRRPIDIEATFEGLFDSVVAVKGEKRIKVGKGFGKKYDYDGRIVLLKVSDVIAKPLPRK